MIVSNTLPVRLNDQFPLRNSGRLLFNLAFLFFITCITWSNPTYAQCVGNMDNGRDLSTVCNLVPNSGFENGVCDNIVQTIGLDAFSMNASGYPNRSKISDWRNFDHLFGQTPDLYARGSTDPDYNVPVGHYHSYLPSWMHGPGTGYSLDAYDTPSPITGVDNDRFMGFSYSHVSAEGIWVKLREPLDHRLTYNFSLWVFNTCHQTFPGITETDIAIAFADHPWNGVNPEKYYPENNTLQTDNKIRVPTRVPCTTPADMSTNNGWFQLNYTFSPPSTNQPLEYLIIGLPVRADCPYPTVGPFGNSNLMVDDVVLQPEGAVAHVEISGSNLQCDPGIYEIVNPDPDITYDWYVPNATQTTYLNTTSISPTWINDYSGSKIEVTAHNSRTNCSAVSGIFYVGGCCVANDPSDIELFNTTATDVINNITGAAEFNTTDNILINGVFTIDQNFDFIDCDNILMGDNASIEIDPGVELTFTNSKIRACGERLWNCILIKGESAYLSMLDCEVMDAKSAVKSELGGKFDIEGTRFENNYIGVEVIGKTATQTYYAAHMPWWNLINNHFETTNQLLPPYGNQSPLCGVKVSDFWDGVNPSAPYGIEMGPNDFAYQGGHGIILERSAAFIDGCSFIETPGIKGIGWDISNAPHPAYLPYSEISNCTFDGGSIGIQTEYSQQLTAWNCDFTDANVISTFLDHSGSFIHLNDNVMEFPNSNGGAGAISIQYNTSAEIQISGNNITCHQNMPGIIVGTSNNGMTNECSAVIEANLIFEPQYLGISTWGEFDDPVVPTMPYGLNIINNYIEKPVPLIAGNGCVGVSAGSAYLLDNIVNYEETWENLSYGFYIIGDDFLVECNEVHEGETAFMISGVYDNFEYYANAIRGPKVGWWFKQAVVGDIGLGTEPSDNYWTRSLNDPLFNTDYTYIGTVSDNSNGSLSNYFYRPATGLNALYPDWNVVANGGTPITLTTTTGVFPWRTCNTAKTGNPYIKGMDPHLLKSTYGLQMAEASLQLENTNQQKRTMERLFLKLRKKNGAIQDQQVASIYDQIEQSSFGQLMAIFSEVEGALPAENLSNKLAGIAPESHEDQLLIEVAEIAIRRQRSERRALTESDQMALERIARLCPMDNGQAVYEARHFLGNPWVFKNDCEHSDVPTVLAKLPAKEDSNIESLEPGAMHLYPNPTQGKLFIEGPKEIQNIVIMNLSGQVMLTLQPQQNQKAIDISSLDQGMYFVKIFHENGVDIEKVMLQGM